MPVLYVIEDRILIKDNLAALKSNGVSATKRLRVSSGAFMNPRKNKRRNAQASSTILASEIKITR